MNPSIRFWGGLPSEIVQSYLTIFAASSLARYRPSLWHSVLIGEKPEQTRCAEKIRDALLKYARYGINSNSFLHIVSCLLKDIINGRFELTHLP